jgi:cysteine desulfurase
MMLIYADNAATTPVDPVVIEAMMPYHRDVYYNASSAHIGGMMARAAVESARKAVAGHVRAKANDVIFFRVRQRLSRWPCWVRHGRIRGRDVTS